jgi:hypothetical protein
MKVQRAAFSKIVTLTSSLTSIVGRLQLLRDHRVLRASLFPLFMIYQKDHLERSNHDRTLTKQGQALISEGHLSAST